MKLKYAYISLLVSVAFLSSCLKDTCNGPLGNTFNEINLDSTYKDSTGKITLDMRIDVLEDLPNDYFESVILDDSVTLAAIDEIAITRERLMIGLSDMVLPETGQTNDFSLVLNFDDRRNYIDCQHPGSTDRYILNLDFDLTKIDESNYEVSEFDWIELYLAGHL